MRRNRSGRHEFFEREEKRHMVTELQVRDALAQVQDPELGQSIVDLGMVRDVRVTDGKVAFTLALTSLSCPFKDRIVHNARSAIQALEGIETVDVHLAEMSARESASLHKGEALKGTAEKLNHIKHVIAVMSGKGGVGKSLVAGLLASSLRRIGHQVGVLDADITGPSIPKMFFTDGARPGFSPMAMLPAKTRTGISVMSINLLLESEDQAVIWRGPLISNIIRQFWSDVLWGDLDYLLVDLPPGTSDASLTVLQSLPMSGVVLVTSPQSLAGMVVRKAAQMVRHIEIPVLGLLENMSYFVCPDTGIHHEIFGPSNPELMASQLGMPFLGCLPIDPNITALCDRGQVEQYPGDLFGPISERIVKLAPEASPPKMKKHES
jgi:ATP-binding protein involved in chromosome partitioning